uniref:Phage tail sheath protein n=2 Tax=Pseudomonas phage PaBG TaxID=1335230 RepID=S5WBD5_9CAUD
MSVRAAAASTSIVGTVGEASMGAVNVIVDIFDNEDLRSKFGTPNAQKYGFALYCAEQALSQTKALKFIRVVNTDALTAGAYLTIDDPAQTIPNVRLNVFDDGSNNPRGVWDPENNLGFTADQDAVDRVLGYFAAANPGAWNDRLSIKVRPSNPSGVDVSDERHYNPYQFWVDVYLDFKNANSRPVESYLVSRVYELNGDGDQMYWEDAINLRSRYIRVKNNPFCGPVKIKKEAFEFLKGGSDGTRPTEAQIAAAYEEFADTETVDVNILMNSGYTTPLVQRKMVSICENRGDALAVLDVPDAEHEAARAVNYATNTLNVNSSYAGLYTPFVQIRDTHNDKTLFIPPSGHVCAAMAYTDYNRAVWFAPAGLSRGTVKVLGIRTKYNQGARDALDRAHINPIRNIPGRGYVIMGQETLQAFASAFSNINVRRLVNFVKKSLASACAVSNFDPNDSITRLSLKGICDDFLRPIRQGRGLYAFEIVCDMRNNDPADIANGDLVLDVYLDPVIPAKRVHVTSHIMPTGTYFDENN